MKQSVPMMVLGIVVASSALAAVVNLARPTPLAWIREPLPVKSTPTPQEVGKNTNPSSGPVAGGSTSEPAEAGGITADVVLSHLRNGTAHFVDAREDHEYVDGHLRGSIHIPASAIYQNISRILQQVPPSEKVIVYCGGGQCEASHHVAEALDRDFKFQDVSIYTKGWEEIEKVDGFKPFIAKGNEP